MNAARWLATGGIAALLVTAGCSTDPGVAADSASRLDGPAAPATPATEPATTTPAPTTPPATDPVPTPAPTAPTPPPAATAPVPAPTTVPAVAAGGIDLGDAKTPREYDDFLALAIADIQSWWGEQFPATYHAAFEPLRGGIFAAYPARTTPIPGCGTDAPTTYDDIRSYAAFYCAQGDFMAYDDGEDGLLNQLAAEYGPSILGVVVAHEYGHAIQARDGDLDRDLPTITTEQQADCFAGAWVAHAAAGEAAGITFTDADVRDGLVAMITVRDPIGLDQFDSGGHGSAFDRVGAFQVGFTAGVARCAELTDDPLPLVPNTFQPGQQPSDGNAPFGFGDGEVGNFIASDLNDFWASALAALGVTVPTLTVQPVASMADAACGEPSGNPAAGAVYCPATQQVFLDQGLAQDLYGRFGDFVVGYLLGDAWSDAAQVAMGSPLQGEARALVDDCLTGAWAATLIPDASGTTPLPYIEPGDLDEAIQAALVVGDDSSSDDVLGSGFEKIASFREGVLGGLDACTVQIGD